MVGLPGSGGEEAERLKDAAIDELPFHIILKGALTITDFSMISSWDNSPDTKYNLLLALFFF